MENIANEVEIMQIQVSILKENLENLKKLGSLRKDLALWKHAHSKLGSTAQWINRGRMRNIEIEIKKYQDMLTGVEE